jgi:hypothetical protein
MPEADVMIVPFPSVDRQSSRGGLVETAGALASQFEGGP